MAFWTFQNKIFQERSHHEPFEKLENQALPTKSILFRNSDIFPVTEYEVLSDILDMIYRRRPYFRTHL